MDFSQKDLQRLQPEPESRRNTKEKIQTGSFLLTLVSQRGKKKKD